MLLVFGWSWLKSFSLFNQPQRFTVRFSDVAGLSNNATINVQGVRVGSVEFINFVDAGAEGKMVDVHLKITNGTLRVPKGAVITIQTLGMVGAKYIECTLPIHTADKSGPEWQPLTDADTVRGVDPVRVEMVLNNVATKVSDVFSRIDTQKASNTFNNLSAASEKLNKNMDRLARVSDSVNTATHDISVAAVKFGKTADGADIVTRDASKFFRSGDRTFNSVTAVADDFRTTSSRINKLLDNPNFSGDLRETMVQARATADTISNAMKDFNVTLQDKPLREEILAILTRLQASTENIRQSMETVNKISGDEKLRADLKEIVQTAKEAMAQANNILGDPNFKEDLRSTIVKVRGAATNVDIAAQQMRQVLNKRAPLLQMLFGRPGKVEVTAPAPAPAPQAPVPAPR